MNATDQADMASPSTPLNQAPLAQSAQLAAFLGVMWFSIACAGTGVWLVSGGTLFLQILVSLGIIMTGLTLNRASCAVAWRDLPIKHGVPARDTSWRAYRCQ